MAIDYLVDSVRTPEKSKQPGPWERVSQMILGVSRQPAYAVANGPAAVSDPALYKDRTVKELPPYLQQGSSKIASAYMTARKALHEILNFL